MAAKRLTVIVPTLNAGARLDDCVRSLAAQTLDGVDIIVVDNSGRDLAAESQAIRESGARVISNPSNVGFGAAVNQGIRESSTPFVATLNDDAVARPDCFERLLAEMDEHYETGMCAPRILLAGTDRLDSAGMLIARDGSSRQRGHGEPPAAYDRRRQVLLPSGCAAVYRRDMFDEVGLFDEHFFLYCEDTDLGLRARWKLWECVYVPTAVVEHHYSQTAGAASALKAYYVERNRHFLVVKNFPLHDLVRAPFYAVSRYAWHVIYMFKGQGKAAEFARGGVGGPALALITLRALLATLPALPRLWRERRRIQKHGRANRQQFSRLLSSYGISVRRVASL